MTQEKEIHLCQLPQEQKDSLREALKECRDWDQVDSGLVGKYAGWQIWLCETLDAGAVLIAVNLDFKLRIDFPPDLAKVYLDRVRSRQ